eukprot:2743228-Rhodomonas_salina.1
MEDPRGKIGLFEGNLLQNCLGSATNLHTRPGVAGPKSGWPHPCFLRKLHGYPGTRMHGNPRPAPYPFVPTNAVGTVAPGGPRNQALGVNTTTALKLVVTW